MMSRSVLLNVVAVFSLFVIAVLASPQSLAGEQSSGVPAWLMSHVGEGAGQIAQPVLLRARALYLQKLSEGAVRNPCYLAMDATRPNDPNGGASSGRFYVICEANRSFRAIYAGHGSGRDLKGVADFSNGRVCAKNFGNAADSNLTAGGSYVTGASTTSFKGYYRISADQIAPFLRTFIQFNGEGETVNAIERGIGGHAAEALKGVCLLRDPSSPYANRDGYVPLGELIDYTGGRSDGCTSWSPSEAAQLISMLKKDPTTLYIYPAATDINAVARVLEVGQSPSQAGLYWNSSCLSEIHSPTFWTKEYLEPLISQYKRNHPAPTPQQTPICVQR